MRLQAKSLALLSVLISSVCAATPAGACNNSPDLCAKPYNSVVHLGAHDSPFVRDATTDNSESGNQFYNSTVQLSAGVRLLTGQVHLSNGAWHLCHTSCDLLDAGTLSVWLQSISEWLDENPYDVVTILLVNSDNAGPSDLDAQFTASGITKYSYIPPSTSAAQATWPTLQTLISANTRLLTFIASLAPSTNTSPTTAYLMDEFTYIFENQFENTSPSDFSCNPNRPTYVENNPGAAIAANLMPLMNHFLDTNTGLFDVSTPNVAQINATNSPSTTAVGELGYSAQQCNNAYGKPPTYLLVDFFDQGPAIATVDSLNGVTDAVGRTAPPSRGSNGAGRSEVSFSGVKALVQQVKMGAVPKLGEWIWAAGDWSWGGINLNGGNVLG